MRKQVKLNDKYEVFVPYIVFTIEGVLLIDSETLRQSYKSTGMHFLYPQIAN